MLKQDLFTINIDDLNKTMYDQVKKNWDALAKPLDGLGDFEEIICRIGGITGEVPKYISRKALVIFCADNGVVREGVSQTGKEVTTMVAALMGENASSVGRMTKNYPIEIIPVDIGMDCDDTPAGVLPRKVQHITGDILIEAAMSEEDCLKAIETGIEIATMCKDRGFHIAATGEMGIGNTTTSTALYSALTNENPDEITGRGAGLTDEALVCKKKVIRDALIFHGLDKENDTTKETAFNALRSVGGFDIAGLTGFFIGCAMNHIPVVIDGFISAVAALTAERICSGVREYMIASHRGRETGCMRALDHLGLKPVIDGSMALGEGTGAVMIFPILDMVFDLFMSGTTFADSDIDQYERYEKEE